MRGETSLRSASPTAWARSDSLQSLGSSSAPRALTISRRRPGGAAAVSAAAAVPASVAAPSAAGGAAGPGAGGGRGGEKEAGVPLAPRSPPHQYPPRRNRRPRFTVITTL